MEKQTKHLLRKGIAQSTEKLYNSAQKGFLQFCHHLSLQPLPATEDTLILYVTDLAQSRTHSTIRTYLAGVRHIHIVHGPGNPLEGKLRLNLVLKGINRVKPRPNCPRLSVTPLIMTALKSALETQPCFERAACCVGFFGFLRCGKFTVPSANAYKERHLSITDVAVDIHTNPSTIAIRIMFSKTDQFGLGTIYLGRTSDSICPVSAVLQYLVVRPSGEGSLFVTSQGTPLTKPNFVNRVKEMLGQVGLDTSHYKGHSFCIGVATTAAACGLSEGLIKSLGRWSCTAYQSYIRIPPTDLASISAILIRNK